ncbi:sterol desaturase family protein [Paremcibacter congregatus]|uniref:sterol desaturase family protein n=1 Tax=Paremcibacter congregatus TaxID=2043170 RepID=UPI0030ECECE7|tara:strand:+ start:187 stop:1053 length:867 start_codon:yes stop_codon:yes gene_type:complete
MVILKLFVRIFYVPLMLVGFIGAGVYMLQSGSGFFHLIGLLAGAITVSFLMEHFAPYAEDWNKSHKDRGRDLIHSIVNETSNALSVASIPVLAVFMPDLGLWPADLPIWIQLLMAILVADFGITLVHYFSHKSLFLWRFHAVHHSVRRMYGFNGLMKHPVHQAIEMAGGTLPLLLLGIPQDIAALLAFAVAIQLLLQHSNVDVLIGPFRHVLALSAVHRFHHIKWPVQGDVNFGLFTTIWDHMLGTAVYKEGRIFTSNDLGIGDEPHYPDSYLGQLAQPFMVQGEERS